MALAFIAAMTVAGGALVASRVIKSKPGGVRLYAQRKNIQFSHKFGLIDDFQAATAYEQLARHYERLVRARPLVLAEGRKESPKGVYYVGPFKADMTQREARQILGVTESEAKDVKGITKTWRTMMLKNHPDTGGSPYVAAKINEAKEIILGEKTAKEGSEEEDEEDGSSGLDDTPEEREAKRKEDVKKKEDVYGMKANMEDELKDFDDVPMRDHAAAPYYEWKRVDVESAPTQASPRTLWDLKEDTFHRKATRTKPHFKAIDNPDIWPKENWKKRYVEQQQEYGRKLDKEDADTLQFIEDNHAPGTVIDEERGYGNFEDMTGKPWEKKVGYEAEYELAKQQRFARTGHDLSQALKRSDSIDRVRRMAEEQARRRHSVKRAKDVRQQDTF